MKEETKLDFDAFSAGVEPGGLRSKQDIKVLICYMLCKLHAPLKKNDIISLLQNNGLANYFEASEAFSELLSSKNISSSDKLNFYDVTESGRIISDQLNCSLPLTVREKATKAASKLLKRIKSEEENKVKIEKNDCGYNVTCSISGGDFDLLTFTMYVPDMDQAEKVKENFYSDPGGVYRSILAILTGNKDLAGDFIDTISKLTE